MLPCNEDGPLSAGPDQLYPAESYTTTDKDGFVKLRLGSSGDSALEPVSIPTLLKTVTEKAGDHLALAVKREDVWHKWTFSGYYKDVCLAAKAFIKLGLEPRHGVAILGFNSPEWFLSELGAIFARGISAGIYPTNSLEACRYILESCKANILVVENEDQLAKIMPIRSDLPFLKAIVQYSGTPKQKGVITWSKLLEIGSQESNEALDDRLQRICINECCHLVYTSGTTGPPKAVMLTHDNLVFTAKMINKHFRLTDKFERYVSYLPLSHVAANITDIILMMYSMATVYFADKDALKGTLVNTLKEAEPTVFLGVPRVWEKIQEKMQEVGKANKGIKRQIGQWAKRTGTRHNQRLLQNLNNAPQPSLEYRIANRIAFQKIRQGLGLGKCHGVYAAAAPLSMDTLNYFLSLDLRILEIYGMSECCGPHLANNHQRQKVGSLGQIFPGMESAIKPIPDEEVSKDQGGEICMRGRHVMMGYMDNPEKTFEVMDKDGWLHSGDLGIEDDNGYVTMTGRLKELIITAGGENIPPAVIENEIKKELPCLSNVMLIGDRRKFLSCLLTLKVEVDPDTLEPTSDLAPEALDFCESAGSKARQVEDIIGRDATVVAAIQAGIERANLRAVSRAQKVQKWVILPKDFSVPGGELGPTLKLKRHVVLEKYAKKITALYM